MMLKLMLLDVQEFVMVEKQAMMKLLLNDLLMMNIGVYKDNILTGRYFNQCHLLPYKINKGWTPRPTITIDCVEIEIAPDNWIMAVDANNTNLLLLNAYYNIQWEECSCLRGIRLEDVTVELEKEAYEEMRHN